MCSECARQPVTVAELRALVHDLVDREMTLHSCDETAAVSSVSQSTGIPVAELRRLLTGRDVEWVTERVSPATPRPSGW
jgi:hypothetical protein